MAKRGVDGMEDMLSKRQRAGPSDEEIQRVIEMREQARKDKDYARADQLRSELRVQGVDLFDHEREWRASDGRRGRIAAPGAQLTCSLGDAQIGEMVVERERARAAHDWAQADELRQRLRSQGIEILDKERLWKAPDGRFGVLPGKMSEEGIGSLVQMREQERAARRFDVADKIRNMLREAGVRLDDKGMSWSTDDGRSGYFGSSGVSQAQYPAAAAYSVTPAASYSPYLASPSMAASAYTSAYGATSPYAPSSGWAAMGGGNPTLVPMQHVVPPPAAAPVAPSPKSAAISPQLSRLEILILVGSRPARLRPHPQV